tara:strand:+ start:9799 stop:10734 length:936 start_codon:yes stop_codon:yes gene_type:complete
MSYKTFKLEDNIISFISEIDKNAYNVIKKCLDQNLWIAGGFARKLFNAITNNENIKNSAFKYFFLEKGDIDIFGSKENSDLFVKENIIERRLSFHSIHKDYTMINTNAKNISVYKNDYTKNIIFDCHEFLYNIYKSKLYSSVNKSAIQIQIVDKINHNNIFECLDNFDITNCKYGIFNDNGNISIVYSEDALKFDKEKTLDISKVNTPYLAQRIIKYLKAKGLNKISEESRHKIKEYLFNVLCNNWPSYIKSKNCNSIHNHIIKLNKMISLTPEEIILMLNKISYHKVNDDYSYTVKKDWASETLSNQLSI